MIYQQLFDHMKDEHDLILVESEIQEIVRIARKVQEADSFCPECGYPKNMEIREILENVMYWESCPDDYREEIKNYLSIELRER